MKQRANRRALEHWLLAGLIFSTLFLTGCAHCRKAGIADETLINRYTEMCANPLARKVYYLPAAQHTERAPSLLVLHELPGLTPACADLGIRLSEQGFNVYMPLFFGRAGKDDRYVNNLFLFAPSWHAFSKHRSPDVTGEMRQLAAAIAARSFDRKVGVIGMCYSGSIPLALLDGTNVARVVLAQPARPAVTFTDARKRALGISKTEIDAAQKASRAYDIRILGLRFERDKKSPQERFNQLQCLFGANVFKQFVIPFCDYGRHKIDSGAHAVLTTEFRTNVNHPTYQAFQEVVAHFNSPQSERAAR